MVLQFYILVLESQKRDDHWREMLSGFTGDIPWQQFSARHLAVTPLFLTLEDKMWLLVG